MAEVYCALKTRAEQLAGEKISCDFENDPACDGTDCWLLRDPQVLTLWIRQKRNGHVPTGQARFLNRLGQTGEILGLSTSDSETKG